VDEDAYFVGDAASARDFHGTARELVNNGKHLCDPCRIERPLPPEQAVACHPLVEGVPVAAEGGAIAVTVEDAQVVPRQHEPRRLPFRTRGVDVCRHGRFGSCWRAWAAPNGGPDGERQRGTTTELLAHARTLPDARPGGACQKQKKQPLEAAFETQNATELGAISSLRWRRRGR
jgi:hypothetical protein